MFLPPLLASLAFFALSAHANTPEKSKAFLKQNAKKQGVITLPSGLQYSVIKKGDGIYVPTENSPCSCHYHGTHIDGSVFDSSIDRGTPATFSPDQVSLLILCRHSPVYPMLEREKGANYYLEVPGQSDTPSYIIHQQGTEGAR